MTDQPRLDHIIARLVNSKRLARTMITKAWSDRPVHWEGFVEGIEAAIRMVEQEKDDD